MNRNLLKEIVSHVMANFAVIPCDFINRAETGSLHDAAYILPEKFCFEEEDVVFENKIWGCQFSALQNEVKVLLTSIAGSYEGERDYVLMVQSKDAPIYALYLCYNSASGAEDHDLMLAVSIDGKSWMECTTFLQATFLAAMEQVKDLGVAWKRCSEYKDLYAALMSFIEYHDGHFGN